MRAYLFDFNGVLVDDELVHFAAMRDVLAPRGATLTEKDYLERYFAFDDVAAFRHALRDAGLPHDEAVLRECIEQKLERYFLEIDRELKIFDGAWELLRACAARGPVAIVSGALRVEIDKIVEKMRAKSVIETIVAAEDVSACKPDPAGYLEALRRLRVPAHDAVVLEDSLGGIEAARAAGCVVVAVAHSYPAERLRASGAALVVSRIAELDVDRLDAARSGR